MSDTMFPNADARIRVGCDVVDLAEIEYSLTHFGDRFLRRLFTADEIHYCAQSNRVARLAARFAAKEAVIKAFSEPTEFFVPTELEVVNSNATPALRLHGSAAARAAKQGWFDVALSLTHADCHAAAFVAVLCR
jgi:holo-[acyl-carrier protein] synthase